MNKDSHERQFWDTRATSFERLDWARRGDYLGHILDVGGVRPGDRVLDVGTGIGLVAQAIVQRGARVTAIDISAEMIARAHDKLDGACGLVEADLRRGPFAEGMFDKLVARMVFHHVLQDVDGAVRECIRWLRPRGVFILSEGVPPHARVRERYEAIFRLKEERRTFYPEDLIGLLSRAGMTNVRPYVFVERQVSIGNWLRNSGLPAETQAEIMRLHLEADDFFKEVYGMTERDGDCWIDMKFVTVVGEKAG